MPVDPQEVAGHWVHSYEDDGEDTMVFRPADYAFPPARGRNAFELRPDGSYVAAGIGPTDAPQESTGTWKLEDDKLELEGGPEGEPGQLLDVVSVAPDKLIVKR